MTPEEYFDRAEKHYNESNYDGTIADLTEMIRVVQSNPMAYFYRGMAYKMKSEGRLAIADFTEAIRIVPDRFGNFYFERGCAYLIGGDIEKATADLEIAVKIDPKKNYREILEVAKDGGFDAHDQKKRRKFFWIFFVLGLIIGQILVSPSGVEIAAQIIAGAVMGLILGVLLGFGSFPWIGFAKGEWEKVVDDFKTILDDADGIVGIVKNIIIVLILTFFVRPIKLFLLLYICPFIGIYQSIKRLAQRKKSG